MSEFYISRARGVEAWDEEGVLFRRKVASVSRDDAARVIKHGGKVGLLHDWGDPHIRWVEPGPGVEKLTVARNLVDRLTEGVTRDVPEGSIVRASIWRGIEHPGVLLLIEAEY